MKAIHIVHEDGAAILAYEDEVTACAKVIELRTAAIALGNLTVSYFVKTITLNARN